MRSPMQNHKKNLQVKNKHGHGSSYIDEQAKIGELFIVIYQGNIFLYDREFLP